MGNNLCDEKCAWTANLHFCKLLEKRGIPLDNKWPPLILELRASPFNPLYSDAQKTGLQNVLIQTMELGEFSEASYVERQKEIFKIIVSPVEKKIQDISDEVEAIAHEVNQLLGRHTNDVSQMADGVDEDIASGKKPEKVLAELRTALRKVVKNFEADKAKFESLSFVDSLTRLANRRKFDMTMKEAVEEWEESKVPLALIFLDIDHFKTYNDNHGHLVGDEILATIAKIVKHTLSSLDRQDYLAARFGGDEFAIILRGSVVGGTKKICEIIRKAIARAKIRIKSLDKQTEELEIKTTTSIGASVLTRRGLDDGVAFLIDGADKALYHAKESGRNCSVFYTSAGQGGYSILSEEEDEQGNKGDADTEKDE